MTTIKLKNGSGAPTSGDLVQGEPALDLTNKRLYTEDSGGTVIEVGTNPGTDVTFADNRKAIFGAGSDLQIYHDGSMSYIDDAGNGDLRLRANNDINFRNYSNDTTVMNLSLNDDSEFVQLYYAGSKRFETTSSGIDVTGTITGSGDMAIDTNTLFVDVSANAVGIGTTSPAYKAQISDSGNTVLSVTSGDSSSASLYLGDSVATRGRLTYDNSNDSLAVYTDNNERMRLDSSGEFTLGNPSAGSALQLDVSATGTDGVDIKSSYYSGGYGPMKFHAGGSERIRIDSSGNTTFKTSAGHLSVEALGGGSVKLNSNGSMGMNVASGFSYEIDVGGTEVVRIDASGNLLVSKSSLDVSTAGLELRADGLLAATRSGSNVAVFRRLSDDGSIVDFQKDGSTVGSIGAKGGTAYIAGAAKGLRLSGSGVIPVDTTGTNSDATYDIGDQAVRFKDLYLSGSVGIGASGSVRFNGMSDTTHAVGYDSVVDGSFMRGQLGMRFITGTGGGSERMRIDSSGNLCLNSNGSTAALDGVIGLQVGNSSASSAGVALENSSRGYLIYASGSDLKVWDSTDNSDRITLRSNGNVGIGESSPDAALHVKTSTNTPLLLESTIGSGGYAEFKLGASGATIGYLGSAGGIVTSGAVADLAVRSQANLTFATGGSTERVRIDSSGNLLVGTTSTADTDVGGKIFSDGRMVQGRSGTGLVDMHDFYRGTAGSLSRVGNIRTNGTSTTYNTSSDQRLKDNIVDAPSASDDIDAIQVRSFDWKVDGSHQKYGMVAQELQSVAPEAVTGDADSDDMMGVDYSKLVPMMMKEIQSLRARVAQLEGEN